VTIIVIINWLITEETVSREFTKTAARNETVFDSMMFTSDTFGSLYRPENEFLGFTYTNNQISQGLDVAPSPFT
jgi:hypothetical protein